jgi:predicted adenylyl cyclase CyaB
MAEGAEFRGTDHQRDTYYRVPFGRLKLRQGNIEKALIHYHRPDQAGPKTSEVHLAPVVHDVALARVLADALGWLVVVDKVREIYFIGNVKFHIDTVEGLGRFVEIEAIDTAGDIPREELQRQCRHYMQAFGIREPDLVSDSYSDMLLRLQPGTAGSPYGPAS